MRIVLGQSFVSIIHSLVGLLISYTGMKELVNATFLASTKIWKLPTSWMSDAMSLMSLSGKVIALFGGIAEKKLIDTYPTVWLTHLEHQ